MPAKQKNKISLFMDKIAAEVINMPHWEPSITYRKTGLDIVTDTDIKIENFIKKSIEREFPDHSILSEEKVNIIKQENNPDSGLWIIDPIDGTINFAAGMPLFGISIAYLEIGKAILGRIILPKFKSIYKVQNNSNSYKNGKIISVSNRDLQNAVIGITLTSHFSVEEINKTLEVIRLLSNKTRGIRIIVSESLELAWIAEGILDGSICVKSDIFGAAAGKLLIEKAGGIVTNFDNDDFLSKPENIIASNGAIHDKLLKIVENIF